jgi:hypothetical protein
MSHHNQLYTPLYTLKPFAENLWIVDGPIIKFYTLPFTTRMTVVKLENDDLLIHSPIPLTAELQKELNQLGEVKHIISPNKIHYWYIDEFKQAYPQAITWASPGVIKRAKKFKKSIQFERELQDNPPREWQSELDQLILRSNRFLPEVIFFHQLSKTLIVTDLIENFEAEKISFWFRVLARFGGALAPHGGTTKDLRLLFWGRKAQLKQSIAKIYDWQPEKIVIAHGKCFEKDAMTELKRIFAWV